jgi:hypothetical protein
MRIYASNVASSSSVRSGTARIVVTPGAGSVSLTFPMRGEDGLTFDFLFRLEAGLQHLEFLCERAKLSNHIGGPLSAQRLSASDRHQFAHHELGDGDYTPSSG